MPTHLTVTKCRVLGLIIIYIGSISAVGFLVYFLAGRPYPSAISCSSTSHKRPSSYHSINDALSESVQDVRLSRKVLPRHYNVRLLPILQKGNFTVFGRVAIDVECTEETNHIVLHSADIIVDLKSVKVIERGEVEKTLLVDSIHYEVAKEFLVIRFNAEHHVRLEKGINYTLSMDFVAILSSTSAGFFHSVYIEDGVERYMAVSQMEPTDARRAFPCFDEPNMKATFTVTLGRHRDMKALSNMPMINTTEIDGMENYYWDHFAPSVLMSTYLVCFVVANFTKIETDVGDANWKFNIHVRTSAVNQAQYAKVIGPKALAFFEDYFQIPFPLPKQDMVAVPSAFAGGMENWGLVTFGESALLFEEGVSSLDDRQTVVELVTHELAHSWFGNLVTMSWWDSLWLKEGFTSYVECIGAEHVDPSLQRLQQFVTDALQGVMRLDALESSHPISVQVNHPNEIGQLFDDISYKKGAAITRMLAHFIGNETFRNGLAKYLRLHQYGNAVQDDLWNAFDKQAKQDGILLPTNVTNIMSTWTLKKGFPVVTVRRDYNTGRNVLLTQERFLVRRSNITTDDPTVYLWWTPLTYTADFKAVGSAWLADDQRSKNLTLAFDVKEDEMLVFNVNQTGYYRVNYDSRNWFLIGHQLMSKHTSISVINRAQIMNDALNLARAGLLDYGTALGLTRYLQHETEYLPWESTLTALGHVDSMMRRTSRYGLFKDYINRIMWPLYNSLGFVPRIGDSHLTGKLRRKVVERLCSMGHKDCVAKAIRFYSQWMTDPVGNATIVPPVLKEVVACTAIRHGAELEWDFAFKRFRETNVASEKSTLLSAMTCSQETWILARMLEMCLNSTTGFQTQDALNVILAMTNNPTGRFMTFYFIRDKWAEMTRIFTSVHSLAHIFESVTKSFNTDMDLKELTDFVGKNRELLASATRSTHQSIDRVRSNLSWMRQNYQHVVDWLEQINVGSARETIPAMPPSPGRGDDSYRPE